MSTVVHASSERTDERSTTVQSLVRGLSVIAAFDATHAAMSVGEIARRTGLNRAAAGRFVRTLEALGYVRSRERTYELTAKVLELGFSYLSALSLPEIAQPHLEALSREVNESTSASVLDGTDVVYVARVPTQRIMSLHISIGTRFPAAITAMGRVLLAALPDDEVDRLLDGPALAPRTPFTLVRGTSIHDELSLVRRQGYALADQELEPGLRSVAVPITQGTSGPTIAAVLKRSSPLLSASPIASTQSYRFARRVSLPIVGPSIGSAAAVTFWALRCAQERAEMGTVT